MTHSSLPDPEIIGLAALAETLSDDRRAQRFLELTGIGTDELRRRAGEPALLVALLGFLAAHEPDLIAVAGGIGLRPAELIAALAALDDSWEQE